MQGVEDRSVRGQGAVVLERLATRGQRDVIT